MSPLNDTVQSAWHEIHNHLLSSKAFVDDEIGRYPAPIAACDQQFNYLLEKRRLILDELKQLDKIASPTIAEAGDPAAVVVDFLQSSQCLDADTKMHFKAMIQATILRST